jgi:hypothetical protein
VPRPRSADGAGCRTRPGGRPDSLPVVPLASEDHVQQRCRERRRSGRRSHRRSCTAPRRRHQVVTGQPRADSAGIAAAYLHRHRSASKGRAVSWERPRTRPVNAPCTARSTSRCESRRRCHRGPPTTPIPAKLATETASAPRQRCEQRRVGSVRPRPRHRGNQRLKVGDPRTVPGYRRASQRPGCRPGRGRRGRPGFTASASSRK